MTTTTDLSVVKKREALKPLPNSAPYWHRLQPGLNLGFRPAAGGGAGSWIAKSNVKGDLEQKTLGSFGEGAGVFAQAKAAAEAFHAVRTGGGDASGLKITVADACRAYAKKKPDAVRFFERSIYKDEIAKVKLEDLRRSTLAAWRERLEERAPLRRKTGDTLSKSSINREMAPVRAALYAKLARGMPNTEAAWQEALKKNGFVDTHNPRRLDLDIDERRALIANILPAPEHQAAKPFIRGLCVTSMRPGILAKLNVEHFNKRTCVLTVPHKWDKGRIGREINWAGTPAAELFLAACKGKLPGAPLFTQANGQRWDAETWKGPIRAAAEAAGLSDELCAYTLRHAAISDLVADGTDLFTVAQMAGTSIKQIEETYGKLRPNTAQAALKKLAV